MSAARTAAERHVFSMVRILLILVFVVISYWILRRLAPVLTPVLAAAGIAYLLDPLVDRLVDRGVKRVWAVTLLLVAFLGSVGLAIALLMPRAVQDTAHFVADLPTMLQNATLWIETELGYDVPDQWQSLSGPQAEEFFEGALGPVSGFLGAALGGLLSLLGFLAELLLIPVFAFYFLLDWDEIVERARQMIPPRNREKIVGIVAEIDQVVSVWIRGQLTVISLLAVLYALAFWILDVHLAIPVGILVGLLTIIPFLGTFVGAAITGILLALDWQGAGQALGVAGVFVVLHLLEAAVLTPKIVGKKVGLGESGALFAVLAGGKLLGFAGVFLAVPLAAGVAVLIRHAMDLYENSEFFGAEEDRQGEPER